MVISIKLMEKQFYKGILIAFSIFVKCILRYIIIQKMKKYAEKDREKKGLYLKKYGKQEKIKKYNSILCKIPGKQGEEKRYRYF